MMDDFVNRSEEEIFWAIMDKLQVIVIPGFDYDDSDTTWAEG